MKNIAKVGKVAAAESKVAKTTTKSGNSCTAYEVDMESFRERLYRPEPPEKTLPMGSDPRNYVPSDSALYIATDKAEAAKRAASAKAQANAGSAATSSTPAAPPVTSQRPLTPSAEALGKRPVVREHHPATNLATPATPTPTQSTGSRALVELESIGKGAETSGKE